MRIVAGQAKGRKLNVAAQGTRPTSERTREAVFSRLNVLIDLDGARVLDLFAGTGALGLEALSRGASTAVLVEKSRAGSKVLSRNVQAVGLGGKAVNTGAEQFLSTFEPDEPFDLVFIDPPYGYDVVKIMSRLFASNLLADDACLVLEYRTGIPLAPWPAGFEEEVTKAYGDSTITIGFVALSEIGEPSADTGA